MKRLFTLIIATLSFAVLSANEPIVIGIAGGTGSGKTTLAARIQEAFPGQSVLISQDSYYKDIGHLSLQERGKQISTIPILSTLISWFITYSS